MIDLEENASYIFTAMSNDDPYRFVLHFGTVGIENNMAEDFTIYAYNSAVNVIAPANASGQIYIYNTLGQQVVRTDLTGGRNVMPVEAGMNYIVKVVTENGVETGKVLVK